MKLKDIIETATRKVAPLVLAAGLAASCASTSPWKVMREHSPGYTGGACSGQMSGEDVQIHCFGNYVEGGVNGESYRDCFRQSGTEDTDARAEAFRKCIEGKEDFQEIYFALENGKLVGTSDTSQGAYDLLK